MDDLASKLGDMLNSPGALDQIKNLVGLLGSNSSGQQSAGNSGSAPSNAQLAGLLSNLASNPQIAGLLGGAANNPQPPAPQPEQKESTPGVDGDMLQTIMKIAPLLSSVRQEDDSTRLLHALRPMLGSERQKKLDEAIKLLQLMRIMPLLKGNNLLGGLF